MNEARRLPIGAATIFLVGASRYLGYACSPERIFGLGLPEIEFPCRRPEHFQLIGPVIYTPPDRAAPPHFETDGRQHVLITMGTHLPHAKAAVCAAMRSIAARHPRITFHFSGGSEMEAGNHCTGNFHEYPYVSYARHLHRYDLVVHHGGAGIMYFCLHHGKPAVVLPFDFDQFDNAARLEKAGLALRVRSTAALEAAILQALGDPSLRSRCEAMSTIVRRSDAAAHILAELAKALKIPF